jgi:hypothetical protein
MNTNANAPTDRALTMMHRNAGNLTDRELDRQIAFLLHKPCTDWEQAQLDVLCDESDARDRNREWNSGLIR